jgi:hypothetical protein
MLLIKKELSLLGVPGATGLGRKSLQLLGRRSIRSLAQ